METGAAGFRVGGRKDNIPGGITNIHLAVSQVSRHLGVGVRSLLWESQAGSPVGYVEYTLPSAENNEAQPKIRVSSPYPQDYHQTTLDRCFHILETLEKKDLTTQCDPIQ